MALGLTAIPDSLTQLANLQSLHLSELAQFSNLEVFDLSGNQITAIPDSLAELVSLRELNLSGNQITAIPDSLAELANLDRKSVV